MKSVTLLEFRRHAEKILRQVEKGERLILTRRGRPAARLEPVEDVEIQADDPIYRLSNVAAGGGETLSNRDVDRLIYGT